MTLGLRQIWTSIPEDQLPDVLASIENALESDRQDDGHLQLTQQVRYTTAHIA